MGTATNNDEQLQQYLKDLPKVELHAHLNGCIRETTLFELAEERGVELSSHHFASPDNPLKDHHMYNVLPRSLQDCFDMFAEIPACVNDLAALERITWEALQDFAAHHVVYLELRSTPKCLLRSHKDDSPTMMDKKAYIETILKVLQQFQEQEEKRYQVDASRTELLRLPMVCRFIVAIDRSQSLQQATENINIVIELSRRPNSLIVGVDLGGNPMKQDFRDFLPLFQKARDVCGLKITLRCAEIPCSDHGDESMRRARDEAAAMLDFRPNRLGHALLLPPSLQQELSDYQIPVETCPTSNVMTLELAKVVNGNLIHGLRQHPALRNWFEANHPLAIGTDDPGVFDTTATKELFLLVHAFGMSKERIAEVVVKSIDYAFCEKAIQAKLREIIQCRVEEMNKV